MAIKRIKLPNGEEFRLDEWLHWPLYSTVESAAARAIDLRAFSYVVGQNVPRTGLPARVATPSDTNQVARARINHDEAFIVFSMTFEHFAIEGTPNDDSTFPVPPLDDAATAPILSGTNLRLLQQFVMYELFVGAGISKPMASGPLSYFGQGIGAVAYGSGDALTIANGAATALNLDYGTAGCVSPKNQRRWPLPVYIGSDRVISVRLRSPGGALTAVNQDWQFKAYLDGLKRRAVA